jgi:hypothetical protein
MALSGAGLETLFIFMIPFLSLGNKWSAGGEIKKSIFKDVPLSRVFSFLAIGCPIQFKVGLFLKGARVRNFKLQLTGLPPNSGNFTHTSRILHLERLLCPQDKMLAFPAQLFRLSQDLLWHSIKLFAWDTNRR